MRPRWKLATIALLLLLVSVTPAISSAAQKTGEGPKFVLKGDKAPTFDAKDRELISTYYKHVTATEAPASIDRSGFSLEIEKSLVAGSHVPMQLEKELQPLPGKLESQLSLITGDYRRYRLRHHILLVRKADSTIVDIIKDVDLK